MERYQSRIIIWLSVVCFLIMMIVMIGGITRLTQSGLSMVDWRPIMGIMPPLSDTDWHSVFQNYQQFPEYQQLNPEMSLFQFKRIFFWEYVHRMLGRIIGLAIVIPLGVFWVLGWLNPYLIGRGVGMTVLVIIQGIMGWMMVKSGLIDLPHVSHIRLMMHLGLAFFLFGYTWWTVLTVVNPDCKPMAIRVRKGTQILLGIIVLQIIYGAFSAGLKAGYIMNTFPKMGDTWIPDGLMILSPFWHNFIHNPMMVQFIHRGLAWILLVGILLLCGYLMFRQSLSWFQRRSVIFLGGSLVLQFILGVITLVYHVPLHAAVAHQLMGLLVFIAILTVYFGMRLESTGV